jgi:two-component system, sensor histidine kinase and response regulator
MIPKTVGVPADLAPTFVEAERVVAQLFAAKREVPSEGTIEVAGERYVLVRAASLSVRFFELVRELYGAGRMDEADEFARNILFDLAHGIGKADAQEYARQSGVEDPIARLSAGPVYFAFCGWARVELDPASVLSADDRCVVYYDHPYSFESEAWLRAGRESDFPVCMMNAGYSAGWCESALGVPLIATELLCRARGDATCRFVMAPPHRIEQLLAEIGSANQTALVRNPDFFARKRIEDQLRQRERELEQKQAELRRSERFLHDIIENLPFMVFVKEAAMLRFVLFNRAGEQLLGVPREQLIGKNDYDFFPKEQADFFTAKDREVLEGGEVIDIPEEPIDTVHGRRILHTIKDPLLDDEGVPAFLLGISEDITERKRQADELVAAGMALRAAKEEAEQASRAKSQFLANMSHEIRTPMNGILGMTELLSGMELSSQQRDYVETIHQSAETLLHLLNGILDLSRIEAGHLELESTSFSLREALGDALQTLGVRAARQGLELIHNIPPEVPDGLIGDPIRLRQVILNLVDNAVKFTDQGEIVVSIELIAKAPNRARLRFEVTDTGRGIALADQERIFKAFEQASTATTAPSGGTGLGLAISSELVEMMGGELELESELGRGSRFWFTIEFGLDESVVASGPRRNLVRDVPVLIVDDNATNRRVLAELLASWRLRPTTASDGIEALERLRSAAANGRPFRVLLLDAVMPVMSGLELARSVREDRRLQGLSIILLSSAGIGHEIAEARELGIGRFLIKPVKQSDLLSAIERELGEDSSQPKLAGPSPSSTLRVLLAEDDPVNQRVAKNLLTLRGHEVTCVDDGQAAVERLMQERERFDVVLMDVRMPRMDGLQATRAIREWEQDVGGHIPIVAMTAQAMAGDRELCLAAGMDDYVSKPVRGADLAETLLRVSGGSSRPEPAPGPAEPPSLAAPVLDWDRAVERLDGDEAMMREVAEVFFEHLAAMIDRVRDAVERSDGSELRDSAHRFKGAASALGAEALAELARRLEQAGREQNFDSVAPVWHELEAASSQLAAELQARLRGTGPGPASRE